MRFLLLKLVIFAYFSFSFISVTHIFSYEHQQNHNTKCHIYLIIKAYNDTDVPKSAFHSYNIKLITIIDEYFNTFYKSFYNKNTYSQAPPLFITRIS